MKNLEKIEEVKKNIKSIKATLDLNCWNPNYFISLKENLKIYERQLEVLLTNKVIIKPWEWLDVADYKFNDDVMIVECMTENKDMELLIPADRLAQWVGETFKGWEVNYSDEVEWLNNCFSFEDCHHLVLWCNSNYPELINVTQTS